MLAHQPPQAPAQREPRNARRADHAAGACQAKGLNLVVVLAPGQPRLRPGRALRGIHADTFHPGEVNHNPAIIHRIAGDIVTAAPNGNQQLMVPGEIDGLDHIGNPHTANDQGRFPINHPVPHHTGIIIPHIAGLEQRTAQICLECLNGRFLERLAYAGVGHDLQSCHAVPPIKVLFQALRTW